MIPTLPLAARNRLADTILRAVHDGHARRTLAALAAGEVDAGAWLDTVGAEHLERLRARARRAHEALAPLALDASTLDAAAALFDAGLGFEVHELLEPHWSAATGREREALQGLIQIAVGYQHLANGNVAGARALLGEGATRLSAGRLDDLDVQGFVAAVLQAVDALPDAADAPRFPRKSGQRDTCSRRDPWTSD